MHAERAGHRTATDAPVDDDSVPRHIAFIMDGNGRWAERRGWPRVAGYRYGELSMKRAVDVSLRNHVGWMTVYVFSTENWNRPPAEVRYLMNFNNRMLRRRRDEYRDLGVRIRLLGELDEQVPARVAAEFDRAIEMTRDCTEMNLCIAFNYGGRAEISRAIQRAISADEPAIGDAAHLQSYLDVPDMPMPDLVFRSGGEKRLSNFLTWQSSESYLYFVDTLWPDVTEDDIEDAIAWWRKQRLAEAAPADL